MVTQFAELVASAIDRTHDVVLTRGFSQGWLEREDGAVCLEGGVAIACGLRRTPDGLLPYPEMCADPIAHAVIHALQVVANTDDPPRMLSHLTRWNDAEDRSIDDVLDLCRETSKLVRDGLLKVAS